MIFAGQNVRFSSVLKHKWECPMPASIQKGSNVPLSIFDDKEFISCYFIARIFARLIELQRMADEKPCFAKNRSTFELKNSVFMIP